METKVLAHLQNALKSHENDLRSVEEKCDSLGPYHQKHDHYRSRVIFHTIMIVKLKSMIASGDYKGVY